MTVTVYAATCLVLVIFSLRRALQYAKMPIHLRWEVYPVPHEEPSRFAHGQSAPPELGPRREPEYLASSAQAKRKSHMTSITPSTQTLEAIVQGKVIRVQKGDLTALPVDAVVFYARQDLQLGAGFGSAIQARGGAAIKTELEKIGTVEMGGAVITSAGNMKARHIIHACGPKFQEPDREKKLRKCMQSALQQACARKLKTVAFPPMGAGFYGVPLDLCVKAMLDEVQRFLKTPSSIEEVIICVIDDREFKAFRPQLEALSAPGGSPDESDQSAVAVR